MIAASTALDWLPWAVGGVVALAAFRDKRRSAWRDQAEALAATVSRLEVADAEKDRVIKELQAKVAELESRPDYRQLVEAMQAHDERTIAALDRICERLVPTDQHASHAA